ATPPVAAPSGWVVNTSCETGPTETVNAALSTLRVPSLAVSTYPAPALSILQPEKLVTPLLTAPRQPLRLRPALPVPDLIDNDTVPEYEVTTFPPASSAATFGCCGNASPPVADPSGCWVNANCVTAPKLTATDVAGLLVALQERQTAVTV